MALRGDAPAASSLKLVAAILSSRIAVWFYLHTAVTVGMERGDLRSEEILALPFPQPEDLPYPAKAKEAAEQIVALLDGWRQEGILASSVEEAHLNKLDQLVYRYFGLNNQEIALIEDTAISIQPSVQPREHVITPLAEPVREEDYSPYAEMLKSRLADWMPGQCFETSILEGNDLALLKITMADRPQFTTSVGRLDKRSMQIVEKFYDSVAKKKDGATLLKLADVRLFSGPDLFLLKPRTRRYWLRATALADADDIAADLFATKGTNARG
jgi:hypothetical protein